ncbi:unnamed protein product [Rotaria sp. Silwood1]|nr:unnamed protein product [Rotaria sp. Silwood1]
MDEVNANQLNTNDNGTSPDPREEHSSSALFVFQQSLSDSQQENIPHYQLNSPLCVSQQYEKEFFDYFHMNYFGELEHEGLFLASVRTIRTKPFEIRRHLSSCYSETNDKDNEQLLRAIIRTQDNNYDVSGIINIKNEENILQFLLDKTELSSICYVKLVHDIKANEKILEFDKYNDEQLSNKVGIVYQQLNQSNEIEILSNNEISIEMENFLNLISELVQLKNFNKYRAPMISSDRNDREFIQRKSLIANALICIIFQEENGLSFQPDFFLGKVTQVYIIVQPIQIKSNLYYKIEIWRRTDIEPIVDPSGGIFKRDESFRDYFLTLILNTTNTILKKDFFRKRIIEQRSSLKNEYLIKLSQIFYSYSKHDLSMLHGNDDNIPIENSNIREDITSKHLQIPKITKNIEKLNVNRRSRAISEKISLSDSEISPTITKRNPLASVNQKLRYISSLKSNVIHPHSPIRVESPSSLFNRVIHQQEEDLKLKESSNEAISSLITNVVQSIGPNREM